MLLLLASGMVACTDTAVFPAGPSDDHSIEPTIIVDTTGMNIPAEAITVARAIEIGDSIGVGNTTTGYYYVKGFIKKFGSKHEDGMNNYGNAIFYMYDGKTSGRDFEAYQIYNIKGERFTSLIQLAVGDYVVVRTRITNYNTTIETPGKGEAYLYASNNPYAYEDFSPEIEIDTTGAISCAEAVQRGSGYAVVVGYATSVSAKSAGQQTVWMSDAMDGAKTFQAYYCNVKGEVVVGDYLAVEGTILVYNTTTEIKNGNMQVLRPAPKQYDYLTEDFASGIGDFTIEDQGSYPVAVWSHVPGEIPCMRALGQDASGQAIATESWLISPAIDLSEATAPQLSFSHKAQNVVDETTGLSVYISTDGETWSEMAIPNPPASKRYTESGDIDLTTLAGSSEARIALVYRSTTTAAPGWSVNNIYIGEYK